MLLRMVAEYGPRACLGKSYVSLSGIKVWGDKIIIIHGLPYFVNPFPSNKF